MMAHASNHKARVPGGTSQPLVLTKEVSGPVPEIKMEVAWPFPVYQRTCDKFLRDALGKKWMHFVTRPAAVPGAHQEAGTAEEDTKGDKKDDQKEGKKADEKEKEKDEKKGQKMEGKKGGGTKQKRKQTSLSLEFGFRLHRELDRRELERRR